MKKVLFALCLAAISCSAMATSYQLTGAVVFNKVPGSSIETPTVQYNAKFASQSDCTAAISAIEHATFSPYAQVTKGGKSEGDIQKFVFLQCLPITASN